MQVVPTFHDGRDCQREHYEKELKKLNDLYRFTLYCEEIRQTDHSIAEDFAIRRRKRYVNIDFPKELRECHGIPNDYSSNLNYTREQIEGWHCIREDFMFHRAVARMNSPEVVVLVICGDTHRLRLKGRFEIEVGCRVEGESFLKKTWYDESLYQMNQSEVPVCVENEIAPE